MPPSPRATICILTYGNYLPFFLRCFESVLANTPRSEFELRLGFNDAATSFAYAMRRLCPAHVVPPGGTTGLKQLTLQAPGGHTVRCGTRAPTSTRSQWRALLYHGTPLTTEYAIWFDDDSYVEAGWWEALTPVLERGSITSARSGGRTTFPGKEK